MDPKYKNFKEQLERAGGLVFLRDGLPDEIAEAFIKELMACPDCAEQIAAASRTQPPPRHAH
jgi:hypothetical protein